MSAIIRSRAWQGYLGLAPFLRLSINGESLLPVAQSLLAEAGERPDDAPLWMNLATAMMCLGQREAGLAVQQQALMLQRVFELPHQVPAAVRVLMLMAPGDVAENIPLMKLATDPTLDARVPLVLICRSGRRSRSSDPRASVTARP